MTDLSHLEQIQEPQNVVEDFLDSFGGKCVEFGYYCDQYMREEINLGEITRRLSEATGEGEAFFATHHAMMTPEQVYRFQIMQRTLDEMATTLIEAEIKRNKKTMCEALRKGEYFIVNITYNSIHSSIYMAYNGSQHTAERDHKLAEMQQEQELTQALMKVLKAVEQKINPPGGDEEEFRKLAKVFQIYVEYFKRVERSNIKDASDDRIVVLFGDLLRYFQGNDWFNRRQRIFEQLVHVTETLREGLYPECMPEIEQLRDRAKPPDPTAELSRLYEEALKAQGEANIYSAVIAFNNFIEAHPYEPRVSEFKRKLRQHLVREGLA